MRFEPVHVIWDLYDGVRTGIAEFRGSPHYFSSIFDGTYTDQFELSPVTASFLEQALEQWRIFRAWERLYHTGKETLDHHPDGGGVDARYDELEVLLREQRSELKALEQIFQPAFRALPGQEDLPPGILHELEVRWHVSAT